MAKQEAFLDNQDLGDSLDAVEAMMKKHEDFEKSLAAHEEKVTALGKEKAKPSFCVVSSFKKTIFSVVESRVSL